jgi:hypothetical protein
MRKVLWIVDGNKNRLLKKADYIRAQAVCVRTTNSWLEGSLADIKRQGFDVYGWRWPAVIEPPRDPRHHYAMNEAAFVGRLIDAGLDGYIADPESDAGRANDDWNDRKWAPLANQFCDAIAIPGVRKNPKFIFGTTSGCRYPTLFRQIPWPEFVAHSDALYPQCYWIGDGQPVNGGTPQSAFARGMKSWRTIAPPAMRIIPLIGEIAGVKAAEIDAYQDIIDANGIGEIHFYTFTDDVPAENWDALRRLGTTPLVA